MPECISARDQTPAPLVHPCPPRPDLARLVAVAREAARCEPSRKRDVNLVFASTTAVVAAPQAMPPISPPPSTSRPTRTTPRPYFARPPIAAALVVALASLALGAAASIGMQRGDAPAARPAPGVDRASPPANVRLSTAHAP